MHPGKQMQPLLWDPQDIVPDRHLTSFHLYGMRGLEAPSRDAHDAQSRSNRSRN